MSTPNDSVYSSQKIIEFYSNNLQSYGSSSKGVGWKNDEAQTIRFIQLARVIDIREGFSINDLGCGTGQFYKFLLNENYTPVSYTGYDILPEMVSAAKMNIPNKEKAEFIKIDSSADMRPADYSVASGIFNVKYEAVESKWLHYVLSTIEHMYLNSKKGFAFNLLTKYSDKEFMQSYLYYADPLYYFDFCKRNFSKNVALLHDYDQYDFTIIVRK